MNEANKKAMVVGLLALVIGVALTALVYEWSIIPDREQQIEENLYSQIYNDIWQSAYNAGYSAGQAVTARPASIDVNIIDSAFANFSATVDANGSVSTETTKTTYITIENPDDITAEDIYITLYNPLTDKGGLHDDLEVDELEAYVTSGGIEYALFYDGDYTDGFALGDLASGGKANVTFKITLKEAVAGTFQDGQTYTCYVYVYQKNANYVTPIKFTVKT